MPIPEQNCTQCGAYIASGYTEEKAKERIVSVPAAECVISVEKIEDGIHNNRRYGSRL